MSLYPDSQLEQLGISRLSIEARGLREHQEATTVEWVETGEDGRDYLLTPDAAVAWRMMKTAAQADGIVLYLGSAYRSVARQVEIIRTKLDAGIAIDEILTLCAPPGYSEHHTGRAVDIATVDSPALEVEFETTPAFAWLLLHAGEFGFTLSYPRGNTDGYVYEPWHWCFQSSSHQQNQLAPQ
ncbi:MAG: M15 family metallopeptidase [Betaproteobacteria bacterium]